MLDDQSIKNFLSSAKTIAMVGVSSIKKEDSAKVIRRPSIIVMSYLQEFGYKVIPVNQFSVGKNIVNVFRPSSEAPLIAKKSIKIGTKMLWLQYGIQNDEAKKIVESENISYIGNKCIKQEYQRLFLKVNPVFPALKN